jgi:DnaJ family protein C protein 13
VPAEGAILTHLLSALSPRGGAGEAAAALSRDLVALWADEFAPALGLLRRVFPPGLLRFLNQRRQAAAPQQGPPAQAAAAAAAGAQAGQAAPPSGAVPLAAQQQQPPNGAAVSLPAQPPPAPPGGDPLQQPAMPQQDAAAAQQQQQQQQGQQQQGAPSPVGRRLLEPAPPPRPGTLKGNWEAFWAAAARDHSHAALIWNEGTRAELRQALQAEEAALRLARLRAADAGSLAAAGGGGGLSWNHAEFRVAYPSLEKHLCIGGIYVRLLLEAPANSGGGGSSVVERLPAPREFFAAAHHRLLCLGDASLAPAGAGADRELCARAMAAAYHAHAGAIGPVEGIAHLAALLDATPSRPLRWASQRLHEQAGCIGRPAGLCVRLAPCRLFLRPIMLQPTRR